MGVMKECTKNLLKMSLIGISCIVVLFHLTGAKTQCNLPTSMWCDNEQIASNCKVTQQCHQYVWSQYSTSKPKLVNFTLYMESLCPDCKNFILSQLYPAWKKVGEIMKLTLIPYGNAKETRQDSKWSFTCQHGPDECIGNTIQTCAIHLYKDVNKHFPFIYCMEAAHDIPAISSKQCAAIHGLNYDALMMCANSTMGNYLEHQMAVLTEELIPRHTFVPWVTLNGVHTDKIQMRAQNDLVELICDAYMGPKPGGCRNFSEKSSSI